jgi:SseB protein C-terminal domain/SseB protein N-terminal domain
VGFPENHVEAVLARASQRQADAAELLAALAEAELLVPVAGPAPARAADARARLPTVEDGGLRYVPVFTSATQLQRYGHAGGHLRLHGRDLAAALDPATGLAVNLRGDLGLPLTPAQVRAMAGPAGRDAGVDGLAATLPAGRAVRLGEPAEEPSQLLDCLAAMLAGHAEVRAAYRALLQPSPSQAPRLLVGLELDDPDAGQPLLEAAGRAARQLADRDVDLVAFGADGDGGVGTWMQLHTRPFHRRG